MQLKFVFLLACDSVLQTIQTLRPKTTEKRFKSYENTFFIFCSTTLECDYRCTCMEPRHLIPKLHEKGWFKRYFSSSLWQNTFKNLMQLYPHNKSLNKLFLLSLAGFFVLLVMDSLLILFIASSPTTRCQFIYHSTREVFIELSNVSSDQGFKFSFNYNLFSSENVCHGATTEIIYQPDFLFLMVIN